MILGHGLFVFWQPVHFSRVALATLGVIPGMYSFWKAVVSRPPNICSRFLKSTDKIITAREGAKGLATDHSRHAT